MMDGIQIVCARKESITNSHDKASGMCKVRDIKHKLKCKLKRKGGMKDERSAITPFTNYRIIIISSMNIPFVITTARTRRQLKVEVEFFNVCKLLNILLYDKDKKQGRRIKD